MMSDPLKKLIVVGDRVLVAPQEGEERTKVGLYLPPTAVDHQAVQGGRVLATGPGTPLSAPTEIDDEPWKLGAKSEGRFLPVQARVGDFALFFRKAAVEISYEGQHYLVVPQAAILVLVRPKDILDELGSEG
jgi:chaperonin GroES